MSAYRISFARVTRAEWGKLTALRSTWVVLSAAALITVGLAVAINWNVYRDPGAEVSAGTLTTQTFLGVDVISLILGVFGVLMITGEFGSGLIRATFAAVPGRLPVLPAKAVALVLVAFPVMLVACTAALVAGEALLPAGQQAGIPARALLGAAAAPVALALIGLGIGALVRHTAAAITVYVLTMLVLPAILRPALPESIADDVLRFVPVAAAQAMYAVNSANPFGMLAPGPATLTVAAWAVLTLGAGSVMLRRRDP
ncbi:ABC transporter permease subunit [Paractinoplanes rishiriensis]|uniref:ABC transporter permease n=1 Tax=Paractinoplanes rishiriensis TaxID=1050105 RepID=A0A919K836_9ACTN|nr:ABC transporter permease subunit [Actinoplanes rishiriensis]GIF01430.1 ABC transporter permease [Actinoplanes rishiriensis]